jgi:hypothetical protein
MRRMTFLIAAIGIVFAACDTADLMYPTRSVDRGGSAQTPKEETSTSPESTSGGILIGSGT